MANWFAEMCAEYDLVPGKPKKARNITLQDVMFTVTGEPRFLTKIEYFPAFVRFNSHDGWIQTFDSDKIVSLLARRP